MLRHPLKLVGRRRNTSSDPLSRRTLLVVCCRVLTCAVVRCRVLTRADVRSITMLSEVCPHDGWVCRHDLASVTSGYNSSNSC